MDIEYGGRSILLGLPLYCQMQTTDLSAPGGEQGGKASPADCAAEAAGVMPSDGVRQSGRSAGLPGTQQISTKAVLVGTRCSAKVPWEMQPCRYPAPESDGRMLHPGRGDARMAVPCTPSCPEQRTVAFLPPSLSSGCAGVEPQGVKSHGKRQFIQPDISQLKCPGLNQRSAPMRTPSSKAAGSSEPQPGSGVVIFQPNFNKTQSFSHLRACHISGKGCECSRDTARWGLPPGDPKGTALQSGFSSAFWHFL